MQKKYNISLASVSKILREFNFKKVYMKTDEELHKIFIQNKDYLINSNGKIPRPEICEYVGINMSQFKRMYSNEKITLKRVHSLLNKPKELKDEFIQLYNSETNKDKRKQLIKQKMNLSETDYIKFKNDRYITKNINKRKIITKKEYNNIVNFIKDNENLTRTEIAKKFNVSTTYINSIVKKFNIPLARGKKYTKLTPEDELNILKIYRFTGSLYGVHKKLGFHKNTIKKCLVKHGIKPPTSTRIYSPISEDDIQNIIRDYENKVPLVHLTKKYHRSVVTIKKIIQK